MLVKYENNLLTVVTDVTKEAVEGGFSDMKAYDEKGNALFGVGYSAGQANICTFGFTGNAYIDGKLAAQILMADGTKIEEVQKMYGEALLNAQKYTAQIAEEAAQKTSAIAAIFA